MGTYRIPAIGAFRSIRARLLFWILVVAIPIYAGATYLSYQATARRLEADAIREADQLAARLASSLDALIRPIEGAIRTVAFQLEAVNPPRAQYRQRLHGILEAWPEIYGSTIAVEVGEDADSQPFAPYVYRNRSGLMEYADLAEDSYAYRTLPWYRMAADQRSPVWSAPYFDTGGGETWMVTYSEPFFRKVPAGERVLAGVVTADLDLEWVRRTAARSALGSIGMAWLYPQGIDASFVTPVGETTRRFAEFDQGLDVVALRRAGETMLASSTNFGELPHAVSTQPAYLAVRNLNTLDWHLALVIPREQLLSEARQLLNRQILLGVVGLTLLIFAVSLVAAGITRPIRELAAAVGGSGADDLHIQLPQTTRRDELGVLTAALRRLRDSLQRHVELRAESLAAEARMHHELEVSAQIQQSMLPQGRSLDALPTAVEIATALQPAQQVGGDLYDFFPLHDGQVLFTVGDVSDKGIPAALFMARLSALMRVLGAGGHTPARLLAEINARLSEGNDACMFVTAGCGLLDPRTGNYRYASAGHEPPLLRRLEGDVQAIVVDNGVAIGIEETASYPLQQGVIAPGDTLVLYTDGVTEAEAADGTLLGIDRLIALLGRAADGAPATLIACIVDLVTSHAAGFHATDDMTAMAVRFQPPDVTTRVEPDGAGWLIHVATSAAGMEVAQRRLRGILQSRAVTPEQQHDVELIAEEWLTNVVRACAALQASAVTMDLTLTEEQILLAFRDNGPAFDPLAAAEPDLDAEIDDRSVGGLGIHLVRQVADTCHYVHVDGCNLLQVRIRRAV